jgi:hypothetical protein
MIAIEHAFRANASRMTSPRLKSPLRARNSRPSPGSAAGILAQATTPAAPIARRGLGNLARLSVDARLPAARLPRASSPRIMIATQTLAADLAAPRKIHARSASEGTETK